MSIVDRIGPLVVFCAVVCFSSGQTTGNDVPSSPLWPIFSQLLSTQTGRTLQDINALGLSDPTINQLWTSYSSSMAKMSQTPAPVKTTTTTPPPLPDLYQSSYSFSSNANQAAANQAAANQAAANKASSAGSSKSVDNSALYSDILNLLNKLSVSTNSSPGQSSGASQGSSTSAQDVMNAYAQLSGSSPTSSNSNPMQTVLEQIASSAGTTSPGGTNYQALIQQYLSSTGGSGGPSPTEILMNKLVGNSGTLSSFASSPKSLMDQYNSIVNQGGSAASSSSASSSSSYDQLLQQYNQIMGGKTLGTSSSSGSTGTTSSPSSTNDQYMASLSNKGSASGPSSDQLLQMYAQMIGRKSADTGSNAAPSQTTTSAPASAQESFDKQLSAFFPQFKSLFPQSSTGNISSAIAASSSPNNTAQMIFDAILFAPTQTGGTSSAPGTEISTQAPQVMVTGNAPTGIVQNLVNSRAGAEALLSNHVQNVFKTRASREMGCRFLPELLELDVLPTAPINCMNRCPFPFTNSQQYGIYCVCCPPGVNDQTVGMMSMVRGTSYMETPLAVVS